MELIQFGADVNYRAKSTRATMSTMQTKRCRCVGTCQCIFGTTPLFQGMSTEIVIGINILVDPKTLTPKFEFEIQQDIL